jgi:hypothetical protein
VDIALRIIYHFLPPPSLRTNAISEGSMRDGYFGIKMHLLSHLPHLPNHKTIRESHCRGLKLLYAFFWKCITMGNLLKTVKFVSTLKTFLLAREGGGYLKGYILLPKLSNSH